MPEPSEIIRIVIVDDHPMFRRGMADALAERPHLSVVAEAGDGQEALALIDLHTPDVVVTDVDMPGMNGFDLAETLLKKNPDLKIAVLTMHREERLFRRAIDIGVLAYIVKDEPVDSVVEGITSASRGVFYLSPSLAGLVVERSQKSSRLKKETPGLSSLTPAELGVLRLVARNRMSKEIADELGIATRTVGTHRNNIAKKLGLTGKMPLLNWALLNQRAILELEK